LANKRIHYFSYFRQLDSSIVETPFGITVSFASYFNVHQLPGDAIANQDTGLD